MIASKIKLKTEQLAMTVNADNINFYDFIADDYDQILEQDKSNESIRKIVADKFCSSVNKGIVLDFGGGTGSDIKWLIENNYKVIFLEPSPKMRKKAVNNNNQAVSTGKLIFLDDNQSNISNWDSQLPFEKLDGVLCNFAVLNNIFDLRSLFQKLAIAIKQHGQLMALVLKTNPEKLRRRSLVRTITAKILGKPLKTFTRYGTHQQTVYLHSLNQIKKASCGLFYFQSSQTIEDSDFILIHLNRK
jgi:SAM-dependent methyltransferase